MTYLHLQRSNFLLVGGRRQETVHLALQWVVHLHIDVIARRLLLVCGVHTAQRSKMYCISLKSLWKYFGRS